MGTSSDEKLTPYSRIKREAVEWVIPGLVPSGMLTVLAGQQGLGKSLLYCAWASQLAARGVTTIIINAENSPTATTKPRLEALEANTEQIINANIMPVFGNGDGGQWYREIGEWIFETKARLLVLDPFAAFIDSHQDTFRDHHVRRLLEPLDFIARGLNCALVYVKHLTKSGDSDPLSRISDSVAFTAAAQSAIVLVRDGDPRSRLRLVCHAKCNVAELAHIQRWEVMPIYLPAADGLPEANTARLEFRGLAEDVSVYEVLKPPPDSQETSERVEAEEMIREMLALGGVPSRDLDAAADARGISRRTLERARAAVGVEAVKKGSRWYVELSQRKTATGKTATEGGGVHSPANEGGIGGRPPHAGVGGVPSETVSQSPPEQGSLDWLGTASLDELHRGLTDS